MGNHVDFISNGKIMARQIGIDDFFLPRKNHPPSDEDEAGYSPPTTESDSNQDSDQETEQSERTTSLDLELEIGSEKGDTTSGDTG